MSDLNSIPSLSEDELETLGVLLEEEAERQDSFDFFAVHGLMTALIAGPEEFSVQQIWDSAFEENLGFSKEQKAQVDTLLLQLSKEIQAWLDSGQDFPVPADLTLVDDEEEPPLESWAMGFMTGVLLQEESWYAKSEETIAQHLFPIMYASGLFMDEPEMADIDEDLDLSNQMCANIPAAVVEVYLFLHAEK
ncbi:YecA/YgfB family protein [Thalassolituus marinus]|uniref:YecA family protein n=1 Tax=Thalassolituus marinus TaxID=671053 RepID=A0ABS7ZQS6_9GAMM|nr:YecA family protein [Thalassolituus marinus]MCA6062836.1 YecA family protein [Thalassolituus marinus]